MTFRLQVVDDFESDVPQYWTNFVQSCRTNVNEFKLFTEDEINVFLESYNAILKGFPGAYYLDFDSEEDGSMFVLRWS